MATGGYGETSDEIFNFKCTPCAKANKHREAVKYCVECQGYCCQPCVEMHGLFPALVGHKLLDKSNLKSSHKTTDLPSIPTEICSTQTVKIIDMYCRDHDEVGCSSCMTLHHRNCNDVKLVSDVVDIIFNISHANEIDRKLQEKKLTLEEINNSRDGLLEKLNKSKTAAIESVRKFRKELETIFQKLETESIKELEKEYEKLKSILEEQKKTSEDEMDRIKQASGELKQAEGNKAQQFVLFKMAQKKIANTDHILPSLEAPVNTEIFFSGNTDVSSFLQQLKHLGSVRRNTLYAVSRTDELNIRMQNDTSTSCVYGCCLTEEGKLLLADYSNKKLKSADIVKRGIEDHCDLTECPRSVCCISRSEAAVSLAKNSIQFVSLSNQMAPNRNRNCCANNRNCTGVKSISDVVDIIFNITNSDEIDQKYQEKKLSLEKIKNSRGSLLEKLNKSKTESIESIRKFRKELETILQQLETSKPIKELEKIFEKLKSILEEQTKTSEDKMDGIKQASVELKQAEGNQTQQFV